MLAKMRPARSGRSCRGGRIARLILVAGAAVSALTVAALNGTAQASSATPAQAGSNNLFASVSGNGSLLTGNGVILVTYLGTGRYEVTFDRNVSGCAYIATIVNNASYSADQAFTAGGHLSPYDSFSPSVGGYTVVADTSAAGCVTVAAPGSDSQALPYVPTTVELTPGPAANTAGIQVTYLLGAAPADEPFHAAIIC